MSKKYIFVLSFILMGMSISCSKTSTYTPPIDDLPPSVIFSSISDWSFDTDGEVLGNLTVSESKLYVGSSSGKFFALDLGGNELWQFDSTWPIRSKAIVNNDLVIFAAGNRLFALNIEDGTLAWKHESTDAKTLTYKRQFDIWDLKDSSPELSGDIAYYGDQFGTLYGIDISNGKEAFVFDTEANSRIRVKPVISDDKIYFGDGLGTIYSVLLDDASLDWKYETFLVLAENGGSIIGEMKINNNSLYFGLQNTIMYSLNKNTGEEFWTNQSENTWLTGIPLLANNLLYIGQNFSHKLLALDQISGLEEWSYDSKQEIYNAPVAVGNKIVLLTGESSSLGNDSFGTGRIHLIDSSGKGLKFSNLPGSAFGSPWVEGDKLYFGSKDGKVYAVDLIKFMAE